MCCLISADGVRTIIWLCFVCLEVAEAKTSASHDNNLQENYLAILGKPARTSLIVWISCATVVSAIEIHPGGPAIKTACQMVLSHSSAARW